MKAGGHIVTGKVKEVQNVSDDQNWRAYVAREIKSTEVWKEDWGFLVKGIIFAYSFYFIDGLPNSDKAELIRELESQLHSGSSPERNFSRTNATYGLGKSLEVFSMKHLNRTKNPDLMPCPRRPFRGNAGTSHE